MAHDSQIRELSALELKGMIDAGEAFQLVDVRTPEEREIAAITGARLLDQAYHDALMALDRDTPLVFQCHHGIRSQRAAEYFREHGFHRLYNLSGGIDAWSTSVDPSIARY
jgi:rhodanese-related sulfurtransferase